MAFAIVSIVLVNLLTYWRVVRCGFVIDDLQVSTTPLPKQWWRKWSYVIRGLCHTSSKLAHILNLLIHTSVCILVYHLFGPPLSLPTALLFSVHPFTNQCVCWVSGRQYAAAAACVIGGMLLLPFLPLFYGAAL